MSTDVKSSWTAARFPALFRWNTQLEAALLAREAPYLAVLPWLVTAGLMFLALSGLALAIHYNAADAFDSLQFIDRNVNNGWLVHGFHETGTTMVFGAMYLLLLRGLLMRGYKAPGELVWWLQVKTYCWLLIVGWLGYTLTGGTVAYWSLVHAANGATLLNGAPGAFATWFFGGPDGAGTLPRMVTLHIALAFVIFGTLWVHSLAKKAIAPAPSARNAVGFHPYYTSQYFVALSVFALIFAVLVFFAPHFGEDTLNLIPGNPLVVPAKLVLPWYLSPVSAFASVLPGAGGGILGVIFGIGVLFALPWLDRSGPNYRPGFLYRILTIILALDVLGLGWAASSSSSGLSSILLAVFFAWYFLHFLVLTPLVTMLEAE